MAAPSERLLEFTWHDDWQWIIAVNPNRTTCEAKIELRNVPQTCQGEVLFEDRTVAVSQAHVVDRFESMAVHVYRLPIESD